MDNIFNKNYYRCTYCWLPIDKQTAVRIKGEWYCSPECYKEKKKCIFKIHYTHLWKTVKKKINNPFPHFLLPITAILIIFLIIFMTKVSSLYPDKPLPADNKIEIQTELASQDLYIDVPLGSINHFASRLPTVSNYENSMEDLNVLGQDDELRDVSDIIDEEAPLQDETVGETIKIMIIDEYPKSILKTVAVSGQAPVNSVIALYHNGKLHSATTCLEGSFFFPRINMFPHQNMIEVEAFNETGAIIPSNQIEVFVDPNLAIHERGINIIRGNLNKELFALTFDGGGGADLTDEILETLAKYGIKSTFFLTGSYIDNFPESTKQIVANGHEIGNHTDTHPHLTRFNSKKRFVTLPWVTKDFVQDELKSVAEKFYSLTGHQIAPFWRAPYGGHNLEIRKWAEEIGYTHISWTCARVLAESLDTLDWVYDPTSSIYYSAEEIRDKIISFGKELPTGANGGISLMHLSTGRPPGDRIHKQLPQIIEGLRTRGYIFVTIGELLDN
ncbi:MAG: polysaccharide deacetylase family protein [bacterium]